MMLSTTSCVKFGLDVFLVRFVGAYYGNLASINTISASGELFFVQIHDAKGSPHAHLASLWVGRLGAISLIRFKHLTTVSLLTEIDPDQWHVDVAAMLYICAWA